MLSTDQDLLADISPEHAMQGPLPSNLAKGAQDSSKKESLGAEHESQPILNDSGIKCLGEDSYQNPFLIDLTGTVLHCPSCETAQFLCT